jgi:hypothetical protein
MTAFRIVSVLALAVALAASQAGAQTTSAAQSSDETVVTTPAGAAAPPPSNVIAKTAPATTTGATNPMTTDEQVKAWVNDAPKLDHSGDTGANADASNTDAAAALRQIHGEAGVSVGSNGYSSEFVSTLIPIGKDGTLGLAVSQSDYGGNKVDHGRYRLPRGKSQSVAISLSLGDGDDVDPANCVPGFRDGDRYIEPVWVTRLHPEMACTTETDKHAETDTSGQ